MRNNFDTNRLAVIAVDIAIAAAVAAFLLILPGLVEALVGFNRAEVSEDSAI